MEKRLYRSKKDRMLAGVCGGLAEYFAVDPVIIRIIFILAIFAGGFGILAYIIMAIIVPSADSVHNEPAQTIQENVEELKNTAETFGQRMQSTFGNDEKTGGAAKPKETSVANTEAHPHRAMIVFGAILLLVGVIALVSNFGFFHWYWFWNWSFFWPAVLIIAGLLIIFVRRK